MEYPLKGYVILGVLFSCLGSVLLVPGVVLLITHIQNEKDPTGQERVYGTGDSRRWKQQTVKEDPPEKIGAIILLFFAGLFYLMSVIAFLLAKQYFKPNTAQGNSRESGRERSARRKRTFGSELNQFDQEPKQPGQKKSNIKKNAPRNSSHAKKPSIDGTNISVTVENSDYPYEQTTMIAMNNRESSSPAVDSSDAEEHSHLFDDIQRVGERNVDSSQ